MRLIALLFFTLLLDVSAGSFPSEDCANIKISYSNQKQGNDRAKIQLDVTGGKAPYHFFFFDNDDDLMSLDFDKSYLTVENSKYPKYVKVRDDNGCITVVEFNESAK